jgi:hypothetical protein
VVLPLFYVIISYYSIRSKQRIVLVIFTIITKITFGVNAPMWKFPCTCARAHVQASVPFPRDLVQGKTDLVQGKRDLVQGKRDLVQRQKRPSTTKAKETFYKCKRDLVQMQKRPSTNAKET